MVLCEGDSKKENVSPVILIVMILLKISLA